MALRGGIFTGAPVRGLRPIRADFCCTLNVPSPVRVSRSPSRSDCTVTLTLLETVYGHADDGIDRLARVDFRDVSVEGYRLDQLRFVHVL